LFREIAQNILRKFHRLYKKKSNKKKSKRNSVTTVPYDARMYFCQSSPAFLEHNQIKQVVSSVTTETTQIKIVNQEFSIDKNL